jgi:hypothetical protein
MKTQQRSGHTICNDQEPEMRITVGRVKLASIAALACVVLGGSYMYLAQHGDAAPAGTDGAWPLHLVGAYVAATLSFAAFPSTRRADLARTTLMALLLMEIVDRLVFGRLNLANIVADAVGAYAVFASSCLERLRAVMRSDPHAPFSVVYPGDRRRRRRASRSLRTVSPA